MIEARNKHKFCSRDNGREYGGRKNTRIQRGYMYCVYIKEEEVKELQKFTVFKVFKNQN